MVIISLFNYVKQLNLKIYGYKSAFMTTAFSQSSLNWYFIHNTQTKHFCGVSVTSNVRILSK